MIPTSFVARAASSRYRIFPALSIPYKGTSIKSARASTAHTVSRFKARVAQERKEAVGPLPWQSAELGKKVELVRRGGIAEESFEVRWMASFKVDIQLTGQS